MESMKVRTWDMVMTSLMTANTLQFTENCFNIYALCPMCYLKTSNVGKMSEIFLFPRDIVRP